MSEQSISIEETNRIRTSLGMKPIPLETTSTSTEHKQQMSNASLSLNETNKLRLSLGMKPIEEAKSSLPIQQTTEQYLAAQQSKEKDERLRQKLEIAKSKAQKRRKINVVKSLLENEDEEEEQDSGDWLSKISAKPVASKNEPRNVKAKLITHDDRDLAGIRVSHNLMEIDSLGDQDIILTLKDKEIVDDEDDENADELESELLVQKKKVERDMAEKLRTNKFDENGNQRTLLELREEELGGDNNDDGFVLTGEEINLSGTVKSKNHLHDQVQSDAHVNPKKRLQFNLEDLDDELNEDAPSDYARSKPLKMKKPKRKQSKSQSRKKELIDEDGDVVLRPVVLQDDDNDIEDDYELHSKLALKRNRKQKTARKHKTPEELAAEIEEERTNAMDVELQNEGVVIDENSEFLATITAREDESETAPVNPVLSDYLKPEGEQEIDTPMPDLQDDIKEPKVDIDVSGGLGSILNLLASKDVVKKVTDVEVESRRATKQMKRDLELRKIKYDIERRELEASLRNDANVKRMPHDEQEAYIKRQLSVRLSQKNAKEMAEKLKDYNPQVDIKHYDELGRELGVKEAFKHLSHQFHGNGMSKSKTDKKLKKMEDEREAKYRESLTGTRGD